VTDVGVNVNSCTKMRGLSVILIYIYIDKDKVSLLLECTFVNVKSYSIVIQSDPTIMPRIMITKPTIEMIKIFV